MYYKYINLGKISLTKVIWLIGCRFNGLGNNYLFYYLLNKDLLVIKRRLLSSLLLSSLCHVYYLKKTKIDRSTPYNCLTPKPEKQHKNMQQA